MVATIKNADIPLSEITSWIYARHQIDGEKLQQQRADIQKRGVVEPILVRKTAKGYEGIAGYLRFKASQDIGLKTIPSRVYTNIDDLTAHETLAVENFQRQELSDIDTANILNIFVETHKLQQKQIAEKLNVSETYVSHYLSLLSDKEPLREAISKGEVTEKQARLIRALPTEKAMNEALTRITELETEKLKTADKPDRAKATVEETKKIATEVLGRYTKEQLQAEIDSYDTKLTEISKFKTSRDELQQTIDKQTGELKALKTDNPELNRNIKKIMEIEQHYFPAVEEITTLKSQINDLNKTRPQKPEEVVKQFEGERKTVYEKQAKIKAQIDTLTEQLKELKNEHKKLQEQASALTQQMTQIKAVETQIAQAEKNLKRADETVKSYQESHKSAIENFNDMKAKVEAEDRTLLDKRKAIADKIAQLSHEKQQLNGKIANETNYKNAIDVLKKKLASFN